MSDQPADPTDPTTITHMSEVPARLNVMPNLPPLPTSLTSFVGREDVIATIATLLRRPGTRLVTLTGPGGIGKTRVALEVARVIRDDTGVGVGFVGLASVQVAELVLPAIARSLGVPEGDQRFLLERVGAQIGAGACLLVIDNFEQVADAGPVLPTLLAACPGLSLLVTSRAVLRISGEQVFPIPPLTLPGPGAEAEVIDAEAVSLFVARASEVRPDITLTEAAHPAIAEICERLDGLPLAIELAAARSTLLAPPAMLARLTQRLPMLTAGNRDQPARLQTMRNAIGWSYDLLSDDEQSLFRHLGVFVGEFSLEAAVAISAEAETQVLIILDTLVDQSLVRAMVERADEPRYAMLETIREFAIVELVAHGEAETARSSHARYFLSLAQRADQEVDGPGAGVWLPQLDRVRANLHAALAWLIDQEATEQALRLAAALWRYWRIRGYLSEGRDGLASALNLPGPALPSVRADALWKLGYMLFFLGANDAARDHYERSVALFTSVEDRSGEAIALDSLGLLLRLQGDFARAQDVLERALAIRRVLGERFEEEITLANLGMLAVQRGNLLEARTLLEEALDIAHELGAEREIGHRCLTLARVELEDVRVAIAWELAQRAKVVFEEFGDQIAMSMTFEILGQATCGLGDEQRGLGYLIASLQLRLKLGLMRDLDRCVERLATAAVTINPEAATHLLAAANAHRESIGIDRMGVDAVAWDAANATARGMLGAERFDEASREGAHLSLIAASQEAVAAFGALSPSGTEATRDAVASNAVAVELNLTPREQEVLRLVAAGRTNREIAIALYISPATAKRHVTNILAKLQLSTRAAAISWAVRAGMGDD